MHYLYVLQSLESADRFYIGCTSDLRKRVKEHNSGNEQSTKGMKWKLVYYEAYVSFKAARKREYRLKHNGKARRHVMDRIKESVSDLSAG